MEVTLRAAYIALQIGPFVALIFALPYTVYGYVRTKTVNVWNCTYLYTFCLYFLCAYFVTWLPLPTAQTLANLKPMSEFIQLVPFQSFLDIKAETLLRDLAIILFNVALTMPLGYFLKEFFHVSLKKAVLLGFLTSLLYEITQLTGLFFIYPRAYRIFDIDDLIINTLGAYLGYLAAPYVSRLLPRVSDTRNQRLVQGSEVAFAQRAIASAMDIAVVLICSIGVILLVPGLQAPMTSRESLMRFPLFFGLFMAIALLYSLLFREGTLGYRLTGLRLMTGSGRKPTLLQCVGRTALMYIGVFSIPFWVLFFMSIYTEYAGARSILWVLISALLMMCAAKNVLEMMFNAVTNGSSMFYDRYLKTHVAYGSSRKTSLFGIRVLDMLPLIPENVDALSAEICESLFAAGIGKESVTKVRLMAEGVLLDWIDSGLEGTVCELRMDKRFHRKALMVSVPGENKTSVRSEDTYVDMLGGMNLTLETYYAAEKNICIIYIP
ncbi:MAG: VanZ family protein [Oscillospiraceae bacterium]|nr:VanZ family protein [Oscillospiraceae bacterium]